MRFAIWRNTLIVVALYAGAIIWMDRAILRRVIESRPLALALAFTAVQVSVILVMVVALFLWKRRNVLRRARSRNLGPEIEGALALHALGEDQTERLRAWRRRSRYDLREALFAMAATMRGEPRLRLASVARELKLIEPAGDDELRAMRDLARLGRVEDFHDIINWTAYQPLLARAIIADELSVFAGDIPDQMLADTLNSRDHAVALTTLEMLRAWRRTLRIPGFMLLLAHSFPDVRAGAFAALSYVAAGQPVEVIADAIVAGLRHADERVRVAAARAAARMKVVAVSDVLAEMLEDPNRAVSIAAASALAGMGDSGLQLLEKRLASPNRAAASVAFEWWEKAAMGRLEPA
jgi:hypothetical protein